MNREPDTGGHGVCVCCGVAPAVARHGYMEICEDPQCFQQALMECATSFLDPSTFDGRDHCDEDCMA